jgi:hypothetical protein
MVGATRGRGATQGRSATRSEAPSGAGAPPGGGDGLAVALSHAPSALIFPARPKSAAVRPPAECVDSVRVTRFH